MAVGKHAWGECQRCGLRFLRNAMRNDGYIPGLIVCQACFDPKHPQEKLASTAEQIGLRRPAPEISIESDHGVAAPPI